MRLSTSRAALLGLIISLFTTRLVIGQTLTPSFSQLKACLLQQNIQQGNLISRDAPSDSSAYAELNFQWNNCCGQKDPLAYLLVQSAADVQAAIKCGKRVSGIRIVPKGGGHSYGKYSFGDDETLVVDLQNMTEITVDQVTKTTNIGPGALLGQIVWKLYNNGKYGLPYGACPTVGVGYVLGGGYGEFSRLHGMAVDKLREVDIVNVDGSLLTANTETHSDLFWALRGGGAGSFGIVTRYKFEMYVAPEQIVQGEVKYKFEDFPQVFTAWQKFVTSNPSPTISAIFRILPSQANILALKVFEIQNTAGTTEVITNILANQFPPGLGPPAIETLTYLDYIVKAGNEETGFNINITDPSLLPTLGRHSFAPSGTLRAKTFYVPRTTWAAGQIQDIYSMLKARPQNIIIIMRILGGAINNVDRTATAFVHRAPNLYEVDVLYIGPVNETATALPWMNRFFDKTRLIFGHKESYQNHLDIGLTDYLSRYYGVNLLRLMRIKFKYDPGNYFHNPQSVPPFLLG